MRKAHINNPQPMEYKSYDPRDYVLDAYPSSPQQTFYNNQQYATPPRLVPRLDLPRNQRLNSDYNLSSFSPPDSYADRARPQQHMNNFNSQPLLQPQLIMPQNLVARQQLLPNIYDSANSGRETRGINLDQSLMHTTARHIRHASVPKHISNMEYFG